MKECITSVVLNFNPEYTFISRHPNLGLYYFQKFWTVAPKRESMSHWGEMLGVDVTPNTWIAIIRNITDSSAKERINESWRQDVKGIMGVLMLDETKFEFVGLKDCWIIKCNILHDYWSVEQNFCVNFDTISRSFTCQQGNLEMSSTYSRSIKRDAWVHFGSSRK